MRSQIHRFRARIVASLLGVDLPASNDAASRSLARIEQLGSEVTIIRERIAELSTKNDRLADMSGQLTEVNRRLQALSGMSRRLLDDASRHLKKLEALRASEQYSRDLANREPLVSIRIASYVRTNELMQVALPSLFAQSYERFEVVIVNDGPNPTTRRAIESLRDPRVRYFELPSRERYPDDQRSRWLVAGTAAANRAVELAQGTWVGHLDDDDEYHPDHIEKLLAVAWEAEAELSYGALRQRNLVNCEEQIIWSSPPRISEFNTQSSLFLTSLRFFRYDPYAWVLDEPGDWNLIRRMMDANVRIASTSDVVGTLNMVPYTHKTV